MSHVSPESYALTNLSSGIHCIKHDGDWCTTYVSENVTTILGVPSKQLLASPKLWIGRIHPDDVDAVRAALKSVQSTFEKSISYRFRNSRGRYSWFGFICLKMEDGSIVGSLRNTTLHRTLEYSDRIHLAGRNSLSALVGSEDLNLTISKFLSILGEAMVVDRARFIRFRNDGRTFVTHEWVRHSDAKLIELPMQISHEATLWFKQQFQQDNQIAITTFEESNIPSTVETVFKESTEGAVMAVPVWIHAKIEGFACFSVSGNRTWLPIELTEAIKILDGHSKSVERRIEDRKQIDEEFQLRLSEQNYRLLTSHSPVVLFGIDSEGTFTLSEGLGLESMGAGAGDVVGKSVYHIYRNYPEVLAQVNVALSGTESHGVSYIGDKCLELWYTPVFDESHNVLGLSGVAVDITRRKELEQQQIIMMSELDHRVKNNITAVMSLVRMSQQGMHSVEDFAKTLDGRLHALAVAHSALAKSKWSGAWMRDILQLTLQPYMSGSVVRIHFEGPDVELPGMLARPMCMIIHELATNAVKHGALSVETGTVTILTEFQNNEKDIRVTWTETNGPKIMRDFDTGTGTTLLDGLVGHEMNGVINRQFEVDGLICKIDVPLTVDK